MNRQRPELLPFVLILVIIVPVEVFCGLLAYETIGEVTMGLYIMTIIVFNGLLCALAFRSRTAAMIGVLVVALLIIPYQIVLADRLLRVQAEVTRIVAYAYETRAATDTFPTDLSAYTYTDTAMQPFLQEYTLSEDGNRFLIRYYVGSEGTSHWYDSFTSWGYYPD